MTNPTPKPQLISKINEVIEDQKYRLKLARKPQSKRAAKSAIHFWESIVHHLQESNTDQS